MSGELNTLLYIVCLLALVVPIGFWTWKLYKLSLSFSSSLLYWYIAFAILALCDGVHLLNVCVAETVDWNLLMSMLTVGVLFMPPVLVLLQKTIIEAEGNKGSF